MKGSGFLAIRLPFLGVGAAEADDPHGALTHGENDHVGFAVESVGQRLISVFAVVVPGISSNDGACLVEGCHVVERKTTLTDIPGVFVWVVVDPHFLM
jgi:hypothetical protein